MHIPQEIIFLLLLLGLGLLSKNQAIVISVIFLLLIRLSGLGNKILPAVDKYGVDVGIIIILIAVLIPIATGNIRLMDLFNSIKSSYGVIALFSGIIVALIAAYGIQLLDRSPEMTASLVLGTIFSVLF